MLRDVLGHRIRQNCYFEFVNEMEKYYIYKNNAYQIIRMSKHYKLDGGWYVDILIRNIDTNKVSKIFIPYKTFKEKTLFNERPRKSLYYVKKKDKPKKEVKLINESLNFTNEVDTCFETKQDFINFSNKILKKYNELEKTKKKNIVLSIQDNYYIEYGKTFSYLTIQFDYDRELTKEELKKQEQEEKELKKQEKDILELKKYNLEIETIFKILKNPDLLSFYLILIEGKKN